MDKPSHLVIKIPVLDLSPVIKVLTTWRRLGINILFLRLLRLMTKLNSSFKILFMAQNGLKILKKSHEEYFEF